MVVDHIGYLTHDIDKAIDSFKVLGFVQETGIIMNDAADNPRMLNDIAVCFVSNQTCRIELISPTSEDSVVTNMLRKQGDGPYHICYQTSEIREKIIELRAYGYMLIQKPAWSDVLGGVAAFLFKQGVGLIELRNMQ